MILVVEFLSPLEVRCAAQVSSLWHRVATSKAIRKLSSRSAAGAWIIDSQCLTFLPSNRLTQVFEQHLVSRGNTKPLTDHLLFHPLQYESPRRFTRSELTILGWDSASSSFSPSCSSAPFFLNRTHAVSIVYNRRLYLFGGSLRECLDRRHSTWSTTDTRTDSCVAVDLARLGMLLDARFHSPNEEEFGAPISDDTLREKQIAVHLPSMAVRRSGAAGCVLGGHRVFIFGGFSGEAVHSTYEIFNLLTEQWETNHAFDPKQNHGSNNISISTCGDGTHAASATSVYEGRFNDPRAVTVVQMMNREEDGPPQRRNSSRIQQLFSMPIKLCEQSIAAVRGDVAVLLGGVSDRTVDVVSQQPYLFQLFSPPAPPPPSTSFSAGSPFSSEEEENLPGKWTPLAIRGVYRSSAMRILASMSARAKKATSQERRNGKDVSSSSFSLFVFGGEVPDQPVRSCQMLELRNVPPPLPTYAAWNNNNNAEAEAASGPSDPFDSSDPSLFPVLLCDSPSNALVLDSSPTHPDEEEAVRPIVEFSVMNFKFCLDPGDWSRYGQQALRRRCQQGAKLNNNKPEEEVGQFVMLLSNSENVQGRDHLKVRLAWWRQADDDEEEEEEEMTQDSSVASRERRKKSGKPVVSMPWGNLSLRCGVTVPSAIHWVD